MPNFTKEQVLKLLLQYSDEIPDTTISIKCVRTAEDIWEFEKDDKIRKRDVYRATVVENRLAREQKKEEHRAWKANIAARKEASRLSKEEAKNNYPPKKPCRPKLDPEVRKARRNEAARIHRENNKEKLKEKSKKNKEQLLKKAVVVKSVRKKMTPEEKKIRRREINKRSAEKRKEKVKVERQEYYRRNKEILLQKAKERYLKNKQLPESKLQPITNRFLGG